ncbi:phosphatases II [Trametes coccinea BRFM310]|uniref:Phosphatases II n=1 Tax=Trametes coccinea (strain BRFM310) TaxID=1353009 RepID=A0A1Y2IJF6_TRAC3|nr:phosphatases II [Trametes coccinea BRFM310]
MSTAVHGSPPPQPCLRRISRVASEPLPEQAPCASTSRDALSGDQSSDYPLIEQLGRLASQHHASEYNRLKFGPKGSPLVYVPYSVQMPDHYREMQAHQVRCGEQRAWWPSEGIRLPPGLVPMSGNGDARSCESSGAATLQEELSAAMRTPLVESAGSRAGLQADAPEPQPHWQTSESHPIVISTIIPSELIPTISSHLVRRSSDYPVVFCLPRAHLLDRIVPAPPEFNVHKVISPPVPPPVVPLPLPLPPPPPASRPSSTQSIAKTLKLPSFFWVHPTVRRTFLGSSGSFRGLPGKRPRPASFGATDATHYEDMQHEHHKRPMVPRNMSSPAVPQIGVSIPSADLQGIVVTHLKTHQSRMPLPTSSTSPALAIPEVPSIPPHSTARLIGNLYLSSCPGKKVRLDGPVRGRSTVCRDLRSDLERIKNVGVACIVCCLDDGELQSLGVTWTEYLQVARELGIDILRIPIPEGLPPNDPAALDSHLSKLIDAYTLRGSAVLVHCRGGVGRAGIVACCWMLKLGLCGWLDSEDVAFPPEELDKANSELDRTAAVDSKTMRLVERLIAVVRRRRSPKAIETYEQVKFLVDFVGYLREQAEPTRRSLTVDWFADWDVQVE